MLRADEKANKVLIDAAEALVNNPAVYHAACARNRLYLAMAPRIGWESGKDKDMVAFAKQVYLFGDGAAEIRQNFIS